ncbi:PP2C family protein-serine/threonine phosphatase [Actinoplanes sp. N902-109]|uniref:PP2C family protein-serine/threonine phosphatase n=1 Tax=Actinoplanes sp. (strain N902-109) TaxID=649831 RepID=UPI0003293A30|nr:SpoIIE family protein phosphatase [Actinoplanes sp. N902-109]AGL18696.1 serine phosphatase RsbU regulator of sigma subunit-like protein [Actinoplanes sp. N902-109]
MTRSPLPGLPLQAGVRQAGPPAPAPALLRAALDASSEAVVLVAAATDTILLVNAAAAVLVPGLEPGATTLESPLAAMAGQADTFTAEYADRHLLGRRQHLDDDHYAWYLRDTTEEVRRTEQFHAERARTTFLAEAGRRLSASLNQRRCLRTTVELAVSHLADAAVIFLPGRRRHSEWIRLISGEPLVEGALREHLLGEVPGLEEALAGFPPIPSRWLDATQVPDWLLPGFGTVGALLAIPLPGNAEPAGALILARRGPDAEFTNEDEMLARIFAARAGAAISAAGLYREQVDTAAILQADLLPPELPQPDGIELFGSYQAAGDELRIGGDFYDVFGPTDTSSDTVIVLGDVCGKGPEAAVLTGKIRQTLRALRLLQEDPAAMLTVLNKALLGASRQHRFATLVIGSLSRIEHGRVRLTLATGGHPVPLILRTDGTVEAAPVKGTLIGVVPQISVQPATVELAPGEICLFYSDGLTEARGGPSGREQYGEARLRATLAGCRGMPGDAAVERVRQLVSDWVHGGSRDDIAMLAVRAPARTRLSLMDTGTPPVSPFAIEARRGDRRNRNR